LIDLLRPKLLLLLQVKEGEAFGLQQAIKLIDELGLHSIIFQLDSKVVEIQTTQILNTLPC